MTGISKSQVSRLCEEIDERVNAFLERPLEGDWLYLWIDATYVQAGRLVSVATIIAVAVNTEGRRDVLGMADWAERSIAILDGILAQLDWTRAARRKVRDLRRP